MRPGAGASIGVVAELMNMYAPLGRCITAFDVITDGSWRRFGRLLEMYSPADGGVTAEDCDCV